MECICIIFCNYIVIFCLDKCGFLKYQIEYVVHDINSDGNFPAQSKFDMINDWKKPVTGQYFFSFVGLINFYHQSVPYLELKLKPLRRLCRAYYRQPIPIISWTPGIIALFHELKISVTSSPFLSRFGPEEPTFLKTGWSAEIMGWILMQPADDAEYQIDNTHLNILENAYSYSLKMAPD